MDLHLHFVRVTANIIIIILNQEKSSRCQFAS